MYVCIDFFSCEGRCEKCKVLSKQQSPLIGRQVRYQYVCSYERMRVWLNESKDVHINRDGDQGTVACLSKTQLLVSVNVNRVNTTL